MTLRQKAIIDSFCEHHGMNPEDLIIIAELNHQLTVDSMHDSSGAKLIKLERIDQQVKHNIRVIDDVANNNDNQLIRAAIALLKGDATLMPHDWNADLCAKMMAKSFKERSIIAGALIAADIDRRNMLEGESE